MEGEHLRLVILEEAFLEMFELGPENGVGKPGAEDLQRLEEWK